MRILSALAALDLLAISSLKDWLTETSKHEEARR